MTNFSKDETMQMGTVENSISFLKDLGLDAIILIGGEPLIHPHFLDIVRMISTAGMKTYVVTNGVRFSSEHFLDMAREAGVASVTVSFKASNRNSYKSATGRDSFKKAVKAIHNISNFGIPHVVNVTVCDDILENFDEMLEAVSASGAKAFSIDTGKPIVLDGQMVSDGMATPVRLATFFQEAYPKLKRANFRFSVKISIPFCLFPKEFIDEVIADGHILTGCQMVSGRGIIIDPHGNLIPCNHLCDQRLTNVGDGLSNKEEYIQFRNSVETRRFYNLVSSAPSENCVKCSYWKMCGAGCKLYWLHFKESELIGNPLLFTKGGDVDG